MVFLEDVVSPRHFPLPMIRTANLTGPVSRAAGGLYESVRRLVQELQLSDLEVAVLGSFDEFTQSDIAAWDPVTVRAFRPYGPKQFAYSPGYQEFLSLYRPHILHTHGIWIYPSIATHRYAKNKHVPYMISPHGMLDPWAISNSSWKKWIARRCYEDEHLKDARCLRALCESEARAFRAFGLKNPIAIVPNGIDLPDSYKPCVEKRQPRSRKQLLFLGRIHPKKGLVNLIRGFKKTLISQTATSDSPNWQLVVAGWDQGGHEAELMQLCEELGLNFSQKNDKEHHGETEPDVLFHGPAFGEEKSRLLHNADAFILSSFSEGLPMSVLEAWANGLPVVMTPECNLPDGYVANAAIRVETGVESIASGIDVLFSMSDEGLKEMGDRGRELEARPPPKSDWTDLPRLNSVLFYNKESQ